MVLPCVTVEGISQTALENDLVQTRTVLSLWQPCMIFFCLSACLSPQTGLKKCYIFSHWMHNKHAQQSAIAFLPCSWDSVCICLIHCTTLNKRCVFFFLIFCHCPAESNQSLLSFLPSVFDAAKWDRGVVTFHNTYCVNTVSFLSRKNMLLFRWTVLQHPKPCPMMVCRLNSF